MENKDSLIDRLRNYQELLKSKVKLMDDIIEVAHKYNQHTEPPEVRNRIAYTDALDNLYIHFPELRKD